MIDRARAKLLDRIASFRSLPGSLQVSGAAAVLLILGSLMPWQAFTTISVDEWISGTETVPGLITVAIGLCAIVLLVRIERQREPVDQGGVAGLGLLACGVVAVKLISIGAIGYTSSWGIYMTGAAAVLLLIGGIAIFAGPEDQPPSD